MIVLGIDQASRSGWGLHDGHTLTEHGVAVSAHDRRAVVLRALELAGEPKNLLVVYEDHSGMPVTRKARFDRRTYEKPTRNTATILGMGAARGRWFEWLDFEGHSSAYRLGAQPSEWRRMLGTSCNLNTAAWKAQACMWASARLGRPIVDADEAEAVCITAWGAHDGIAVWQRKRDLARKQRAG